MGCGERERDADGVTGLLGIGPRTDGVDAGGVLFRIGVLGDDCCSTAKLLRKGL